MIRTGLGFDAHRYAAGDGIVIAGVNVPCDKKILAHSDGDVLLHSLCDALLGAAALGDIGMLFPNNEENQQRSSREFVKQVTAMLNAEGLRLINADAVIIADSPKFVPFIREMRHNVAVDTHLDEKYVSIKATTTDHLGFIGRGEGIATMVSVLVETTTLA